jgi:hypothetical protein
MVRNSDYPFVIFGYIPKIQNPLVSYNPEHPGKIDMDQLLSKRLNLHHSPSLMLQKLKEHVYSKNPVLNIN